MWGVKPHVVLACIRAGELAAKDISQPGSRRPHWKIPPAAVEAFEARRAAVPEVAPARSRRKKPQSPTIEMIDPTTGKIRKDLRVVGSVKAALQKTK
jgi:hypothetical protein